MDKKELKRKIEKLRISTSTPNLWKEVINEIVDEMGEGGGSDSNKQVINFQLDPSGDTTISTIENYEKYLNEIQSGKLPTFKICTQLDINNDGNILDIMLAINPISYINHTDYGNTVKNFCEKYNLTHEDIYGKFFCQMYFISLLVVFVYFTKKGFVLTFSE